MHVGAGARADVEESARERVTVRDIADREQRGIRHADRLGELLARVGGWPAEGLVEAGLVAGCPGGVGVGAACCEVSGVSCPTPAWPLHLRSIAAAGSAW